MFSMIFRDVDSASYSCKWKELLSNLSNTKSTHVQILINQIIHPSIHILTFPHCSTQRPKASGRQSSNAIGSTIVGWNTPIMILFLRIFFFVVDTHHDLILADAHLIMYWNLNYLLAREDAPCDSNGLSRLYVCVVDQTRLVHHLSYQVGLHSIHLWIKFCSN